MKSKQKIEDLLILESLSSWWVVLLRTVTISADGYQTRFFENNFLFIKRVFLWLLAFCWVGALGNTAAEASPTIQNGGTITTVPGVGLAPPAAMNGFNPLLTSSAYDSEAEGLMYQPLLWVDRDFHINYQLSIAKKIKVGAHHHSFTVYLSKNWKWSDGAPVTAADVAYTYHMIVKLGPLYPDYGSGGMPHEIRSFMVLNPYMFRIVTKRSVNPMWFELSGLTQLVPYPAQIWRKYTITQLNDNMTNLRFFRVVDGPFRLESFHPGRYATMIPNKDFSGPDKPHISRLIFRFLNSNSSVFFALKSGAIQIGNLPAPLYKAKDQLIHDRMVTVGPPWGFNYLGFNFDNPHVSFTRNVLVRQAMMHAINQNLLIKVLGYGYGSPAYGLIPGSPPVFLSPEAKSLLQKGAYDPALADKLLNQAGWHRGPDGIREKNGKKMVFILYLPPSIIRGPTLLADMFAKVGIQVKMREKPFNEVYAQMVDRHNKNWEAVYLAWSQSSFPTGGSIFKCGGIENSYHYCNKELDALGDKIRIKPGLRPLYAFQNYFTAQQPVIVLPIMKNFVMIQKNIHGVSKAITPMGSFYPQYLWVQHVH